MQGMMALITPWAPHHKGDVRVSNKNTKISVRNVMYAYMPKGGSYVLKNIIANRK